jgi:hypothetical protein
MLVLHPRNACPVECGEYLGEMSNQYPHHRTLAFYSTGCKAYALKMQHVQSRRIEHVVKAKGITLTRQTMRSIHYDTFKEKVNNFGDASFVEVDTTVFLPNSALGRVVSKPMRKSFKAVFDKGMVDSQLDCYPFGFTGPFPIYPF